MGIKVNTSTEAISIEKTISATIEAIKNNTTVEVPEGYNYFLVKTKKDEED